MELEALMLLGPGGRVIAMNSTAEQVLEKRDGLCLEEGCLRLPVLGSLEGQLISIARPSGRQPWMVWSMPLVNRSIGGSFCVITIFETAPPSGHIDRSLLNSVFNFTGAEVRLAEQMLLGRTPAEAAKVLQVTIHTVRTYLKRLYGRVGARNRPDLVRILVHATAVRPTDSSDLSRTHMVRAAGVPLQ